MQPTTTAHRQQNPHVGAIYQPAGSDQPRDRRDSSGSILIQIDRINLTTLSAGSLNLWLSPALRGMIVEPLRTHFCHIMGGKQIRVGSLSRARDRSLHNNLDPVECRGCVHNAECRYGRVFEPDWTVIDRSRIRAGMREGLRAMTIGAELAETPFREMVRQWHASPEARSNTDAVFPQIWVETGMLLEARVLSLGDPAIQLVPIVLEAIDAFGCQQGFWGQPAVYFRIEPGAHCTETRVLDPAALPVLPQPGRISRLTLCLDAPLSLKRKTVDGRDASHRVSHADGDAATGERDRRADRNRRFAARGAPVPTFAEILSVAVRTVRRVVTEFGDPATWDGHRFEAFFADADGVPTATHELIYFEQQRASRRKQRPHDQIGWTGTITFADVPLHYVPWLTWAGLVGVGDSRNCGAGRWQIVLD